MSRVPQHLRVHDITLSTLLLITMPKYAIIECLGAISYKNGTYNLYFQYKNPYTDGEKMERVVAKKSPRIRRVAKQNA